MIRQHDQRKEVSERQSVEGHLTWNGKRRIRPAEVMVISDTDLPEVHRWAYDYAVPGAAEDYTPQTVPASEVPVGRDHGVDH